MNYSTLQTIAIVCYMVSGGFLAVSILVFFLWDIRDIVGRMTGSSERRALARMRSGGEIGKTGGTVVDMAALEKSGAVKNQGSGRLTRRSGRVNKNQQAKSTPPPAEMSPAQERPASPGGTPDYFGAPYPNKTPPAPIPPAAREAQTVLMDEAVRQTTVIQEPAIPNTETMDLEQWTQNQTPAGSAPGLVEADDAIEPVEIRILDDIVLIHTDSFIEI